MSTGTTRIPPFILASGSPRRKELLEAAGLTFRVCAPCADGVSASVTPQDQVCDFASNKAMEVAFSNEGEWVVAADTLVAQGEEVFSKPKDRRDAERMLQALASSGHDVWTGMALVAPLGAKFVRAERSRVVFAEIPQQAMEEYLDGDEWVDKAGAYGIQGWARAYATILEGTFENVMGLDLKVFESLFVEAITCSGEKYR
ncbi:MAG: Maf family protein [Planctomycetes bacterium]|nr:Maf family protein [Planctomycetota bacterium]